MSYFSPQWTLVAGLLLSIFVQKSKIQAVAKSWSSALLQLSVVLLGASLNFKAVLTQGKSAVLITFASISVVLILGIVGFLFLRIDKVQAILISMGTAICGGSAIGALAPVIKASSLNITVSIAIVFLLNAISVFVFPQLGYAMALSQVQFGTWAALAIHDTSSVVAATTVYGEKALEVGTLVKLTRALWIIPIVFMVGIYKNSKNKVGIKLKIPWFVLCFLIMSLLFTFLELPTNFKSLLTQTSKIGFALTLFFIGLSLNFKQLRDVGVKPLIFATSLWVTTSLISLLFVVNHI